MKPEVYGLDYICGYIYIYVERIYLFMRIDKQNIHVPIDIIISSLSYFRLIVVFLLIRDFLITNLFEIIVVIVLSIN